MKLKLAIISIIFFNGLISVSDASIEKYRNIEFADKAGKGAGWNFEIQNKFPAPIQVDIKNYDKTVQISKILKTSANVRKLRMALWKSVQDGFTIEITEIGKNNGAKSIIDIGPNDQRGTIYLTVAKDKQGKFDVHAQGGKFFGLPGKFGLTEKTESGLLLDKAKNVQKDDMGINQF